MKIYRFNINRFLISCLKACGKEESKKAWQDILKGRLSNDLEWQDICNGHRVIFKEGAKAGIVDCVYHCSALKEWCDILEEGETE